MLGFDSKGDVMPATFEKEADIKARLSKMLSRIGKAPRAAEAFVHRLAKRVAHETTAEAIAETKRAIKATARKHGPPALAGLGAGVVGGLVGGHFSKGRTSKEKPVKNKYAGIYFGAFLDELDAILTCVCR